MDGYLRQSTASQSRLIGPFVDDADFKSSETGLTIANTDITLRANGTGLTTKNSGGATHQAGGMYSVTWDATDTATVGELKYHVLVAGALRVFGSYTVLEEAVYDQLFAAAATGAVPVASGGITTASFAAGAINAAALASDAITDAKVASDVTIASVTGAVGSVTGNVGGNVTGSVGSVATGGITTASFAAGAINAAALGADAITAAKVAADVHAEAADAVWDEATAGHAVAGSTGEALTDAAAGGGGGGASASAIADAVLDELISEHQDAGSLGARLSNLDEPVSGVVADVAMVQADTNDLQARLPAALVNGKMDASVSENLDKTGYSLSSQAIQAIWDSAAGALVTAGSIGKALLDGLAIITGVKTQTDKLETTVESVGAGSYRFSAVALAQGPTTAVSTTAIAAAVWDEPLGAHGTAGTAGATLTAAGTVSTNPPGIKKNAALPNFPVVMRNTHGDEAVGLSVTATRRIDGGTFVACANAVTEVGNGLYSINLAATDLNGDAVTLRFTAPGARARLLTILTEP